MSEDDRAAISSLGSIVNDVGPSQPCCPACTVIIQHINMALSEIDQTKLVVPHSHAVVFGCALPPFLPRKIRRNVIGVFEAQLRQIVTDLREALTVTTQRALSPSVASDQSAPWPDTTTDLKSLEEQNLDMFKQRGRQL